MLFVPLTMMFILINGIARPLLPPLPIKLLFYPLKIVSILQGDILRPHKISCYLKLLLTM